jgi:hypothetical protein
VRYGAIILSQIGIISKPNSYDARIAGDFNEPYLKNYIGSGYPEIPKISKNPKAWDAEILKN